VGTLAVLVAVVQQVVAGGGEPGWSTPFVVAVVMALLVQLLLRSGRVRFASHLFVLGSWLIATVQVARTGGGRSPILGAYFAAVALACSLTGSRTGLLYAVTSSIVLLSLAAAQAAGYLLTPAVAYDATAALFVTLASLVVTGGVGYLSTLVRDAIAARAATSESLYAEVVRTAPEALVTVDGDGRVRGINPAGELLFGQGAAALKGRRVVELPGLEHLAEPGGEAVRVSSVRRADGTTRDVEVEARSLPLAGGPGLRVSARDVTERLRAERERDQLAAELAQAQRLESIGLLAGGVAHDFNNLLTAVLGNAELLRRSGGGAAETAHLVGEIEDAARRGAELTGQLLAFGQRQALRPRHVRPSAVVRAMRGLLRRLLTEDIALEVDAAAEGVACADPGQLGRVLVNLVVNARDAMPRGGTLRVATEDVALDQERGAVPAGAYVRLAVTDSGVGMDPETVRRIFDPFFSTKGQGRGTGLGLAVVDGIVRQSGGYLGVESAPGLGSTFEVLLPRLEGVEPDEDSTTPLPAAELDRGTVLVAEDEPPVRRVMVRALEGAGYRVLAAADGVEALEAMEASRAPIDLLVTDLVMPRMGGAALADRLRERDPTLRVLFVSGYPDRSAEELGLGRAGTRLLPKPFTPGELVVTVQELLARPR